MARKKSLENTIRDANVKANYLAKGEIGNYMLYCFFTSTFGRVFIVVLIIMFLLSFG
jgi:hypothetical protein